MALLRVEQQGKVSPTRMELELHIADAHWVEEERLHHLVRPLLLLMDTRKGQEDVNTAMFC